MADIREAKVPDLGGSSDVPVIEILVAVGGRVGKDQGLITLESDKATMEVPAPFAGVIRELRVKLGDALSEGQVVALIEADEAGAAPAAAPVAAPAAALALAPAVATKPESERALPSVAEAVGRAEPDTLSRTPGVDPEAMPPLTPPIAFTAESLLPGKVPHASPAVRVFARGSG